MSAVAGPITMMNRRSLLQLLPAVFAPFDRAGSGYPVTGRQRARKVGVRIGRLPPGRWNAITDVPGVEVGHATIHRGVAEADARATLG